MPTEYALILCCPTKLHSKLISVKITIGNLPKKYRVTTSVHHEIWQHCTLVYYTQKLMKSWITKAHAPFPPLMSMAHQPLDSFEDNFGEFKIKLGNGRCIAHLFRWSIFTILSGDKFRPVWQKDIQAYFKFATWSYFESGHGKGAADDVGSALMVMILKMTLTYIAM